MQVTVSVGRLGLLALGMALLCGCSSSSPTAGDSATDAKVELAFSPNPPKVGDVEVVATLKDKAGQPLRGATLKLEGNMNHAGMEPSFADAKEAEPGQYKASLKFTMGGDWFILVTGTLSGGQKVKQKIDVPGVKSR